MCVNFNKSNRKYISGVAKSKPVKSTILYCFSGGAVMITGVNAVCYQWTL